MRTTRPSSKARRPAMAAIGIVAWESLTNSTPARIPTLSSRCGTPRNARTPPPPLGPPAAPPPAGPAPRVQPGAGLDAVPVDAGAGQRGGEVHAARIVPVED